MDLMGLIRPLRPVFLIIFLTLLPYLASSAESSYCDQKLDSKKVYVHSLGKEHLPAELRANVEVISVGYNGPKSGFNLVKKWLRDYAPIQVGSYSLSYMAPFNSYNYFQLSDLKPVERLDLIFAGGNIAVIDTEGERYVVVSELVYSDNSPTTGELLEYLRSKVGADVVREVAFNLRSNNYRPREPREIKAELARAFRTSVERVLITPWMPGESTGHVDMWLQPLEKNRAVVPYIKSESIAQLTYGHEIDFAKRTNDWLNERVRELEAKGIKITRIPMWPPQNLRRSTMSLLSWDALFPSSVNWIKSGQKIYIPNLQERITHFTEELKNNHKAEIVSTLSKEGFEVEFINVDSLLPQQGLLHCITAD